jgi:thiamine pyrophosphate-dependent acetolactate synthase large subunit-like protein
MRHTADRSSMLTNDVERPVAPDAPQLEWGSDAAVQVLRDLGVPYVTLNPGSSTRGFHDSLVNYLGNERPQLLTCLHEEHAVAIAHGYAKVTGTPLAIALHGNVGLMHGSMAIFNAFCDRVPMIVLGSNGPLDADRRRPWIDWIHTTADNATLVRDFVKWDDQPASVPALVESLVRGARLASTSPCGPVYIAMDVAVQEQRIDGELAVPDPKRFLPLPDPSPSPELVGTAVERLLAAERPAILAGRVSRCEEAWAARVSLVEALEASVITDIRVAAAFPTDHALHVGAPGYVLDADAAQALAAADVVLSLDWVDIKGTMAQAGCADATDQIVISASVDEYVHRGWSKDHQALAPVDVALTSTADGAVDCLLDELERRGVRGQASLPQPRPLAASASPSTSGSGLALGELAERLLAQLAPSPACLVRVPLAWHGQMADFRHPLDFLGYDGGGGLGSGPGMTIGAALALKDDERVVVGILGDGDFTMGMSALSTAARYRLPLLIVVANNESYFNDELHQDRIARRRGRPPENRWIGQRTTDPGVDCAALARAQGLMGIGPVRDGAALDEALVTAIDAVRAGAPVVVDVHVRREYGASTADVPED